MKILYDGQIYDHQAAGGINRYFSNLITKLPSNFNPTLIIQKVRDVNYPVHPHLKTITWYQKFRPERLCKIADKLYFKVISRFNQFDLVHPTYYSLTTRQNIKAYHCPMVLTVYDMIHELYPQYFKDSRYIIPLKRQAILSAQAVITISENTKKDLINLYNIPENKIFVIYLAPELDISLSYGSEPVPACPYYLYVGSRAKYKNFERLLMAFAKVISVIPDLKLCLVGAAFNKKESQQIVDLKLETQVENYGYISDLHLAKLYRNSIALVYPSLYEGFGIPPLEAMSCGTTVITSNRSSLPEVVGEAGLMFDPLSTDELVDRLLFLINHPLERDKLIHQGQKQSQLFSWDKTVAQTVEIYKSIL